MAIISTISGFLRRHKKKLIFSAAVTASLYFAINQFVIKRFRNFQNALRQELFVKEQIKRRFIQTQEDCYLTVLALLPVLSHPIVSHLPIEVITQALKLKKGNSSTQSMSGGKNGNEISDSLLTTDNLTIHENSGDSSELSHFLSLSKTELWKLLKIKTITRSLTLIYCVSSLLLLTKLQLNILARRSYLESAIVLAGGKVDNEETSEDYFMEQSYLSLSWWLLNKGWLMLSDIIERVVEEKFLSVNARTEMSISQFDEIMTQVIQQVNGTYRNELLNSIFPINYDALIETIINTNPELVKELDIDNSTLAKLVNETNFLVNNDVFGEMLGELVFTGKATLIENLAMNLSPISGLSQEMQVTELAYNKKFKLANLLAQLSVQCGVMCDNNNLVDDDIESELSGNVYIRNLNQLEVLEEFSASIYSSFE